MKTLLRRLEKLETQQEKSLPPLPLEDDIEGRLAWAVAQLQRASPATASANAQQEPSPFVVLLQIINSGALDDFVEQTLGKRPYVVKEKP
ncbi:MAG: hypothetical protein AB7G75_30065 [Candidatus Binatia bacterium]